MSLKPAPIVISDSVYQFLSKFARSRTLPAHQAGRAKIFILCADGINNLQIYETVSIGQDSVSKWRIRFLNSLPRLQEVAQKDPAQLETEVTALLSDYARSGQPLEPEPADGCNHKRRYHQLYFRKNYKLFFKIWGKSTLISSAIGCIPPRK